MTLCPAAQPLSHSAENASNVAVPDQISSLTIYIIIPHCWLSAKLVYDMRAHAQTLNLCNLCVHAHIYKSQLRNEFTRGI